MFLALMLIDQSKMFTAVLNVQFYLICRVWGDLRSLAPSCLIQYSPSKGDYYLLIDWLGGLDGKLFGSRLSDLTEGQISSRPARPNVVGKHVIVCLLCFLIFSDGAKPHRISALFQENRMPHHLTRAALIRGFSRMVFQRHFERGRTVHMIKLVFVFVCLVAQPF